MHLALPVLAPLARAPPLPPAAGEVVAPELVLDAMPVVGGSLVLDERVAWPQATPKPSAQRLARDHGSDARAFGCRLRGGAGKNVECAGAGGRTSRKAAP